MAKRLAACVVILILIQGSILAWNSLTQLKPSVASEFKLADFPYQLGNWNGQDVESDPRILGAVIGPRHGRCNESPIRECRRAASYCEHQ